MSQELVKWPEDNFIGLLQVCLQNNNGAKINIDINLIKELS
jgi:hypothetical protein